MWLTDVLTFLALFYAPGSNSVNDNMRYKYDHEWKMMLVFSSFLFMISRKF